MLMLKFYYLKSRCNLKFPVAVARGVAEQLDLFGYVKRKQCIKLHLMNELAKLSVQLITRNFAAVVAI